MLISRSRFKQDIRNRVILPIDEDNRFYNLSTGFWVYDEFLRALKNAGWIRFAPGFKAGLYGHPRSDYCIKVLGMGVGNDPSYFFERGYYLEHEERMLRAFRNRGFAFGPEPLPADESIRMLVDQHNVDVHQAEMRVLRHDILVMEFIAGHSFATQTGRYLNYEVNILNYEQELTEDIVTALHRLRTDLGKANDNDLLHNDPMPPNIIFTLNAHGDVVARLVDFEISQDLRVPSPSWVNSTVCEQYDEREVPRNPYTLRHTKTLDQHLIDRTIDAAETIQRTAPHVRKVTDLLDGIDLEIPFIGGVSLNLGEAIRFLRGNRAGNPPKA